jgi:hypothetical protein
VARPGDTLAIRLRGDMMVVRRPKILLVSHNDTVLVDNNGLAWGDYGSSRRQRALDGMICIFILSVQSMTRT